MNKRLFLITFIFLQFTNKNTAQNFSLSFPDSFKTSNKYYSPSIKPFSKSPFWGLITIGEPFDSLRVESFSNTSINFNKKYEALKERAKKVLVLIDTLQETDSYEYVFWSEIDKGYYPASKIHFFENNLSTSVEAKKIEQIAFKSFPVYIINLSDTSITFKNPKFRISLIQEALDKNKIWREIERVFTPPDEISFKYYTIHKLNPGQVIVSSVFRYKGDYKTMLRVKIKIGDVIYYSEPFQGSINYQQITKNKKFRIN